MILRCRNCHDTVGIDTAGVEDRDAVAACPGCGQVYHLEGHTKLGANTKTSAEARRVAREHHIDLPGAYSVVLGVMTLDEVQELGGPALVTDVNPAAAADPPPDAEAYDPAFRDAVEAKLLSPRQALERGERSSYARLLASRHRLTFEAACAVADNRMSLLEALRQRGASRNEALRVRVRDRPHWALGVGAVLLPVALAFALHSMPVERTEEGSVPQRRTVGATEILSDTRGRVTQISGPDPESVLRAWCISGEAHGCSELLDVLPAQGPTSRERLGLFRSADDPHAALAIKIREDQAAQRWVAGDGRSPLSATAAPEAAVRSIEAAAAARQSRKAGREPRAPDGTNAP